MTHQGAIGVQDGPVEERTKIKIGCGGVLFHGRSELPWYNDGHGIMAALPWWRVWEVAALNGRRAWTYRCQGN